MFLAGAKNLEAKKEWINELNVFPVPDGDTGTNMTMTIMSAAKEVNSLVATGDLNMESLCKAISSGSLRGARGNSGVILSQLLRGFTKVIKEKQEITITDLSVAFDKAVETAYKAVMKPKEGTILTVAKGVAEKAKEVAASGCEDIGEFLRIVIEHAEVVLAHTPELLPVLKQAGVVDSGGQGLVEIFHGVHDQFLGKEIDFSSIEVAAPARAGAARPAIETDNIKFGYCTEFIIMLESLFNIKHELDFKEYLESLGDSLVLVADDDVVKVHVHTNDPGLAIQRALKYGSLSNIKIDNMRLEHEERLFKDAAATASEAKEEIKEPPKNFGFVTVAAGAGLAEIFRGLGADCVIEGGQTMNPSTEDIVDAIERINAKTVYILPNNKNIILAANQAQYLVDDKTVIVIPTKTIPQGITALINFMSDGDVDSNTENMTEEIKNVYTGQVTYAVRDTTIDDKEIKEGDFMGIGDKGLLSVNKDIKTAVCEMIDRMQEESSAELFSIYYGEDVTEADAKEVADYITGKYPSCDVELQFGGQPIYYYIISAE
ncbi:MAG: DAK2 domain-containing protein [Lachnospiraceae bacterium]|nr:DAK2 domain-containing protein [Lachnospiraceae bacterium]